MGKFSNILLCTDMDGTLMNSNGELSEENRKAINEFIKQDGKFCIATGRLPGHLLNFFDRSELVCPMICCNGSCMYDYINDKVLYECPLGDKVKDVIKYVAQHEEDIVKIHYYFSDFKQYDVYGVAEHLDELLERLSEKVYKVVLTMKNDEVTSRMRETLSELYGDVYNFSRSWSTGLEILNKDATKGKTAKRLQEILGDSRTIIAVGDYENDIELIKSADIGCAVGNAVSELKTVADKIICTNNEHAISEIIKKVSDWI